MVNKVHASVITVVVVVVGVYQLTRYGLAGCLPLLLL